MVEYVGLIVYQAPTVHLHTSECVGCGGQKEWRVGGVTWPSRAQQVACVYVQECGSGGLP